MSGIVFHGAMRPDVALPFPRSRFDVVDARTGRVLLARVTIGEFDRWYDHHAFWHAVRSVEDVAPDLRERFAQRGADQWLLED